MNDGVFNVLVAQLRGQLDQFSGAQLTALRNLLEPASMLAICLELVEQFGRSCGNCPHCAATRIYRHGMAYGLQRYRCLECGRTFNALTGTPLAFLRLRGKWLTFLQAMLDSRTVRATAKITGIHRNTSFRWRHRFMAGARHDRPARLHGIVEVDEPIFSNRRRAAGNSIGRRGAVAARRSGAAFPGNWIASSSRATAAARRGISSAAAAR